MYPQQRHAVKGVNCGKREFFNRRRSFGFVPAPPNPSVRRRPPPYLVQHRQDVLAEQGGILRHREMANARNHGCLRSLDASRRGLGALRRAGGIVLAGYEIDRARSCIDPWRAVVEIAVVPIEIEVALEDPIKELEAKLNATREEAKETYDRLLRVSAEFENYKKRSARDLDDFRKFANQSLLKEMLLVVDNLELAINSANENQNKDNSLKAGLDLTHKEILRVINKFSVTPIEST